MTAGLAELRVEGMTCGRCVARVTRAVESVPSVGGVSVDLETGLARVTLREESSDLDDILSAIRSLGYEVSPVPTSPSVKVARLLVGGMSCGKCVGRVERAASSIEGVFKVEVDLDTCVATVEYEEASPGLLVRLMESIRSAGYEVSEQLDDPTDRESQKSSPRELTVCFLVKGMSCGKCVSRVESSALAVEGVLAVTVDLTSGRAHVTIQSPAGAEAMIMDQVTDAWMRMGYEVARAEGVGRETSSSLITAERKPSTLNTSGLMPLLTEVRKDSFVGLKESRRHLTFSIEGMSCSSCVNRIEQALRRTPGVAEVTVNLATNSGAVSYNPSVSSVPEVLRVVSKMGYSVEAMEDAADEQTAGEDNKMAIVMIIAETTTQSSISKSNFEEALKGVDGVVAVSESSGPSGIKRRRGWSFKVKFDEDRVGPRDFVLLGEVHGLVVNVSSVGGFLRANKMNEHFSREANSLLRSLILCLTGAIPILVRH